MSSTANQGQAVANQGQAPASQSSQPADSRGSSTGLVVYGRGGHGQVVAAAARARGMSVLGFVDDAEDVDRSNARANDDQPPRLSLDDTHVVDAEFCPAIGDNHARARCVERLLNQGRPLRTVIHPSAWVDPSVVIGPGCFIGANAVVNVGAQLGQAVIVNSAAVVEHHNVIANHAHIAPGAVLGGGVRIGEAALVGLGSRILPQVEVAADAVVGGGAVVTRDVSASRTVAGVPAKVCP